MALLGYARVSTPDQDLTVQTSRLKQAGADRIFEDTISGTAPTRPGLKQLLDYAREGDAILIVRLDRLARSMRGLILLLDDLRQRGIGLVSLNESIDTTTPAGKLMLHIIGALAEFERDLIVSRTRDALDIARSRGKHIGRPRTSPEKIEAAIVLVDSGSMTPEEAARTVGIGRSTIYDALRARAEQMPAEVEPPPKPPRRRRGKLVAPSVNA